jgi:nicotinate-nucleotide adenylyltransferase
MLDLAFIDHNNVKICTVEQKLPKPSYTVRTIEYLQKMYIGMNFYLCIGEDSLANFNTWKDHHKILSKCDLLVAERPGVSHIEVDQKIIDKVHFVKHEPVKVSSTTIRSLISSGDAVDHLLPPKVYKYIMDNDLYQ